MLSRVLHRIVEAKTTITMAKKKVLAAVRTMASDAPGRNNYQDLGKELEGETESWGVQKDCDYNKINI